MAIQLILLFLTAPALLFTALSIYGLLHNYNKALKIGIPMIILPVDPNNPIWLLTGWAILPVVKSIFGNSNFTRYSRLGWEYHEKSSVHEEKGDVIVLVTPGYNWLYICDAEALNDLFRRRKDFDRPAEMMAMLDVFGPNISSANGPDWQRQRKVTSAPFNEQNNSIVWQEAMHQADEVLKFWNSLDGPIRRSAQDLRTLSLHIMSGAGFGKSYSFQKSAEAPKPGHMYNYRDSIAIILKHSLVIFILGRKLLTKPYLPKFLRDIGQATVDFQHHMTLMVEEEKAAIAAGKPGGANITNSLIRASEEMDKVSEGEVFRGITEKEIYGNIFLYNFAGHDTTAITLAWAVYLLAANPEVQDWIGEEISAVFEGRDAEGVDYAEAYPRLKRCRAVLLETLRLWNPLIGIAKSTSATSSQPLTIDGREIIIPPNTRVIPNINAIHSHPRYWGTDSRVWRPDRWIITPPASASTTGKDDEELFTPPKGAYIPWSEGARGCPGKKFSQVEFVGTMVALFRKHRVEVVAEGGESQGEARERVMRVVRDSRIVLLLEMRRPETVALRWVQK